jgi:hypothetical protein
MLVCLAAALAGLWAYEREGSSVSSYVQVYGNEFTTLNKTPLGKDIYERRKATHEQLVVHRTQIDAVLGQSEIRGLTLVQSQEEPSEWLRDAIEVKFAGDSELMRVRLWCSPDDEDQACKIVDALVRTYVDKVIYLTRRHNATEKQVLQESLKEINVALRKDFTKMLEMKNTAAAEGEWTNLKMLKNEIVARQEQARRIMKSISMCEYYELSVQQWERSEGRIPGPLHVLGPAKVDDDWDP